MIRRKGGLIWVAVMMAVSVASLGLAAPGIARWVAHRRSHQCCETNEWKRCGSISNWADGRVGCEVDGPCCCSFGLSHTACGCGRSAYDTRSGSLEIGPEPDNGPEYAEPERE